MGERELHNEYVCLKCGHTLLFEQQTDPHAASGRFQRRARYRCNLFGHEVHTVSRRDGFVEYACSTCGHPFLKAAAGLGDVTHPPINIFIGHYVRFVSRRNGYSEHVCRHSGHPFSFAQGNPVSP
jgi:DNA-directed RNA polymerase subunit RPC12/RpoP